LEKAGLYRPAFVLPEDHARWAIRGFTVVLFPYFNYPVACSDQDDNADPCTVLGGGNIKILKGN
jgi:hypothetical protein